VPALDVSAGGVGADHGGDDKALRSQSKEKKRSHDKDEDSGVPALDVSAGGVGADHGGGTGFAVWGKAGHGGGDNQAFPRLIKNQRKKMKVPLRGRKRGVQLRRVGVRRGVEGVESDPEIRLPICVVPSSRSKNGGKR
jgi:hypothetical protein